MKLDPCPHCGGPYRKTAQTPTQLRNLLGTDGGTESHRWRVFTCVNCGHTQFFHSTHEELEGTE